MDREALEEAIRCAATSGILIDKRGEMPKGKGSWPERDPDQILGQCAHQNGSGNFTDPKGTADYHTSPDNHITPGEPLPTTVYHFMIPDLPCPAWLTTDLLSRTYAQGASDRAGYPGDENLHLVAILVMGSYTGPGYKGQRMAPSGTQEGNFWKVTNWCKHIFGYGDEGLFGHYHFGKAACPGSYLQRRIEARRSAAADLASDRDWQEALLRWDENCLPKYGADGAWGRESKTALRRFQCAMKLRQTAMQDPFTELLLLKMYPPT